MLLVHLALGGGGILRLGPLSAAFVGLGRLAGRLRAIHFVSLWHNAPPGLGDRLSCSLELMLHDGESLLVHPSEDHYGLVPTVEGDQEVLPVVDHVSRHRILNARLKGRFDHLRLSVEVSGAGFLIPPIVPRIIASTCRGVGGVRY